MGESYTSTVTLPAGEHPRFAMAFQTTLPPTPSATNSTAIRGLSGADGAQPTPGAQPSPVRRLFHRRHRQSLQDEVQSALDEAQRTDQLGSSALLDSARFPEALAIADGESRMTARSRRNSSGSEVSRWNLLGRLRYGISRRSAEPSEDCPPFASDDGELPLRVAAEQPQGLGSDFEALDEQRQTMDRFRHEHPEEDEYRGDITHVVGVPLNILVAYTLMYVSEEQDGTIGRGVMQRVYRSSEDYSRLEGYNTEIELVERE